MNWARKKAPVHTPVPRPRVAGGNRRNTQASMVGSISPLPMQMTTADATVRAKAGERATPT